MRSDHCRSAQGFSLPHGTLNYVLSLEGDDWFESDRVATLADIYVSNRADSSNTKTAPSSSARVVSAATAGGRPSQQTRGGYAGQTHQGRGNGNVTLASLFCVKHAGTSS